MIRDFENHSPQIHSTAGVDDTAVVIGDVSIGEHSSLWPYVVVRGDINQISIGRYTNIQDSSVIHVTHAGEYCPEGAPTHIGDYVTVGHKAMLHACTIGNYSLVGMNAVILDGAVIESNVLVSAGAVVPPGKVLESGFLYVGNPVKKIRPLTDKELSYFKYSAEYYAQLKDRHYAK